MMHRRLTAFFSAVILIAAALTVHARAQDSLAGEWQAHFESHGTDHGTFYLEMRISDWKHNHTWGNSHKPGEFYGLDPNLASTDGPARFELRRQAGTLAFDGTFHAGKGSGAFRFTSSAEFVQAMKGLGYLNLSIDQLLAFATQDVTSQFVKDLNDLGYPGVSAEQLLALRIHSASPDFIRDIGAQLPSKPSLDDLAAMRIHGVSPEFVAEMESLLGKNFDVDQYVAFRIHGVSPEFVRDVRERVSKDVTADQLVAMRIHGADPEFVKGMDEQLGRKLNVDELVAFRIHGVSPDFVGQMHQLVAKDLSADDLVAFRIHGVSPEFVTDEKRGLQRNINRRYAHSRSECRLRERITRARLQKPLDRRLDQNAHPRLPSPSLNVGRVRAGSRFFSRLCCSGEIPLRNPVLPLRG